MPKTPLDIRTLLDIRKSVKLCLVEAYQDLLERNTGSDMWKSVADDSLANQIELAYAAIVPGGSVGRAADRATRKAAK